MCDDLFELVRGVAVALQLRLEMFGDDVTGAGFAARGLEERGAHHIAHDALVPYGAREQVLEPVGPVVSHRLRQARQFPDTPGFKSARRYACAFERRSHREKMGASNSASSANNASNPPAMVAGRAVT